MLEAPEVGKLLLQARNVFAPRPLRDTPSSSGMLFVESPKLSRRPRFSDRWQNSGGRKGSRDMRINSQFGVRRRYGTVTVHSTGAELHFYEYTLLRDMSREESQRREDRSCSVFHTLPKSDRDRPHKPLSYPDNMTTRRRGFSRPDDDNERQLTQVRQEMIPRQLPHPPREHHAGVLQLAHQRVAQQPQPQLQPQPQPQQIAAEAVRGRYQQHPQLVAAPQPAVIASSPPPPASAAPQVNGLELLLGAATSELSGLHRAV